MSVLEELAARAHRVAADLSPGDAAATARFVLDTVGCAVAGSSHPLAPALIRVAESLHAGGALDARGRVTLAANFAHLDEVDAFHTGAAVLPCAPVVPVALELAHRQPVTGTQLLAAVAAGAEVIVEAGMRLHAPALYARGWWPAALVAPLGAAATASLLLGQDPAISAQALALAAAGLGGLLSTDELGAGHYCLLGRAAADGLTAALAAGSGLRASRTLLDGPAAAALGQPTAASTAGTAPQLLSAAVKMYACARPLHAALEALDELRRRGHDPTRAATIRILLPTAALRFVTTESSPSGPAEAAASAVCAVAALLAGRASDPGFFRAFDQIRVAHLPEVRLVGAPALDAHYPARWGARVELLGPAEVVVDDAVGVTVDDARGGPERPWSDTQLQEKFLRLTQSVWPREDAAGWAAQCAQLHRADAETVAEWAAGTPLP
jgi:2-methylcitrate dehydratase PrpD